MKNIIKYFCTVVLIFYSLQRAYAQQCGNCEYIPSVAQYDLDVQVSPPDSSANEALQKWRELFFLGRFANASLFNANKNCIRFIQPTSDDGELKVGLTTANVPPANKDVSQFGNYLLTGIVKQSGTDYIMHMELQTACSRKTVASAEVLFKLSEVSDNSMSIAQKAVSQLSPLIDKINNFELQERQKDQTLSLFQTSWGEPIKITPVKKVLKAGESTDFTIELKDCDGVPLQGREILFNETTFEGFKIYGTSGGTVSPAKVVTDVNGTAKANFTLKTGAKEAIINAHSPGNHVKGCTSMFIGVAAINIRKTYSGFLKYSFNQTNQCIKTSESNVATNVTNWNVVYKIDYTANFFSDGPGFNGNEDMFIMETGNMIHNQYQKSISKVSNNAPNEQEIKKNQSGGLKFGSVRFGFDDGGQFAELNLKYYLEGMSSFKQTYLQPATNSANEDYEHSVAFFPNDKNFQYKKTTSGGITKHIITYLRTDNKECFQLVERLQLQVTEQ